MRLNGTVREYGEFERLDEVTSDEALLNWFQQERSDMVRVSGPLRMITFVLPKF